jgi:arylsulfatase A-like enzyme
MMADMNLLNRRTFLAAAGAGLTSLAQASHKKNVLFIAIDDLNDWVNCLGGYPGVKTPNLDRLAARGVLFANAHCNAPLCNPSRASLMTGLRPSSTGIYDNRQPFRLSKAKDAVTLAQYFRTNGYKSMGSGKIYHDSFPDPPSWDEWFPALDRQKPPEVKDPELPDGGKGMAGNFQWGPIAQDDSAMSDHKVVEYVAGQLARKHEKPFFLACGIFRPHLPWHVPQKYFDMYPLDKIELPSVKADDLADVPATGVKFARAQGDHKRLTESDKWKHAVQAYLACITFADVRVGQVLDALDKSAYAKNTVIVLWSDHGWHLGEKLHWRKFTLWEEATHNVFMISAPGVTKPGGRCRRAVSMIDIYPTLVELCGLPARKELEGTSLMPLLRNPQAAWDRPAITTYFRNNHAIRTEKWRYIRYSDGGEELYDRDKDPMEWTNLAAKPEMASVKADLGKWLPQINEADAPHVKGVGEN